MRLNGRDEEGFTADMQGKRRAAVDMHAIDEAPTNEPKESLEFQGRPRRRITGASTEKS